MRPVYIFALSILLTACAGTTDDKNDDETGVECTDGTDCPEVCDDGNDNDGDGLADCEDSDCSDECVEDCFDGVDNDGDTFVDCEDADCAGQCTEDCTDGKDNDGDGLIDCDDDDCDGSCAEVCDDGRDNDGDGLVDCDDEDCDGSCAEVCDDGRDNDGDGNVDCEDEDCADSELCVETLCDDGLDNDGDGLIDCEDGDCAAAANCAEDCFDGIDNDGDALIDCVDDDCLGTTGCHPEGITANVLGGPGVDVTSVFKVISVYSSVAGCSPSTVGQVIEISANGTGNSIYGTLQAKPRGATDWTTCDWEVGTMSFSNKTVQTRTSSYSSSTTSSFGPVTRNNVNVDPGCGVGPTDTWFLPQKLKYDYRLASVLTQSGQPWYQGASYTGSSVYSNYTYSSACGQFLYTGSFEYQLNSLQNVGSYLAYE